MSPNSPPSTPSASLPWIPVAWLRWLRVWVYVHVGLTAAAVPGLIGLVGYGLAHAHGNVAAAFLLGLLAVAGVVIATPLALLSPRRGPLFGLLKAVGAMALVVGTVGSLALFGFTMLQPQWRAWEFSHAMSDLRIVSVQESTVQFQGQPAGLRVVVEVDVPEAMPLGPNGMAVVDLLQSLSVQAKPDKPNLALYSPFDAQGVTQVTLEGKPLMALPGVSRAVNRDRQNGDPSGSLPAGRYRVERVFWRAGLDVRHGEAAGPSPQPYCLKDYPDPARMDAALLALQGRALQVGLGTRFDLGLRRGYRGFRLEAPLRFAYQHTPVREMQARHELPGCDGQQRAEQAQAQVQRYLDGDNGELQRKLCEGDEAGVRAVLALGAPKGSVWPMLRQCTVEQPRGELFSLLLPHAYAQSQGQADGGDYCWLLAQLHNRGDLDFLTRIAAQKLPLVCEGPERAELWRNGFDPTLPSLREGPRKPARPMNDDTQLAWLRLMKSQGLPICKPAASGMTLLQLSVKHRSAAVIEFLLDAGCDPHAPVPKAPVLEGGNSGLPARNEAQPILPVAGWTLRRFRTRDSRDNSPIDADRVAAISRRMGNLRSNEINGSDPTGGTSFLWVHRVAVRRNPALLQHLVRLGARLDATDEYGTSWFDGVGDDSHLGDPRDPPRKPPFAMLDALTDAQMRELIRPGPKGLRQLADEHRTESTFNTYLCKRRLGPCLPYTL